MQFPWQRPRKSDVDIREDVVTLREGIRADSALQSFEAGATGADWIRFAAQWLPSSWDVLDSVDDPSDAFSELPEAVARWGFLGSGTSDALETWMSTLASLRDIAEAWNDRSLVVSPHREAPEGHFDLEWGTNSAKIEDAKREAHALLSTAIRDDGVRIEVFPGPRPMIVPANLGGFLALQAADALDRMLSYRQCSVCRLPFRIESRHRREYCSPACKARRANEARPARQKAPKKRAAKRRSR